MIIYFDMDGVLCDFDKQCDDLDCWREDVHKCNWKKMEEIGPKFWESIEPIPEGIELINKVAKLGYSVGIMSAVHLPCGKQGKRNWLKQYLPDIADENIIIINNGNFKYKLAKTDTVLIDDREANVENYKNAGGKAIQFTRELSLADILETISKE